MRNIRPQGEPVAIRHAAGGGEREVIESRIPALNVGDFVEGPSGWQEFAISAPRPLRKVDRSLGPMSTAVGVLGMPQA